MNLQQISVDNINQKSFELKEFCDAKKQKVKRLLLKYGQLKPIIVCAKNERYKLISGKTVLECAKELNFKTVWCLVIEPKNKDEEIDISYNMAQSARDINVLVLADEIQKLNDKTDEQIANDLGIKPLEVYVLKTLLKVEANFQLKRDTTQQQITFE